MDFRTSFNKIKQSDAWIATCSFTLIIFSIVSIRAAMNFNYIKLGPFGDFVGGVLGPAFAFITIFILLVDREDARFEARFDNAFKIYEKYNVIIKIKEAKLIIYSHRGTIHQGFDGFAYRFLSRTLKTLIDSDDSPFEQLLDYLESLKSIYSLIKDYPILKDMFKVEFSNQILTLHQMIDSAKNAIEHNAVTTKYNINESKKTSIREIEEILKYINEK